MSQLFTGAGVALITPFTKESHVDYKSLEKVVENQVKGGMDYLVALGTTAETATLTQEEKSNVVELVKEKSAGLPVVVGMVETTPAPSPIKSIILILMESQVFWWLHRFTINLRRKACTVIMWKWPRPVRFR